MTDALFVSKSLMEKVMRVMLKKHAESLESVRHHGIHDVSLQMERRNTFAELIMPYLKGIDFAQEIEEFHQNHFPLLDYIDRTEVADAAEAMRVIQSSTTFSFTDAGYFSYLFLMLRKQSMSDTELPTSSSVQKVFIGREACHRSFA